MPKGVFKRTKEHCRHLSESHKGQIAWNKGMSLKNGDILLYARPRNEETKMKISSALKGKKFSPSHLFNVRIAVIKSNKRRSGSRSAQWKGGKTPLFIAVRNSLKYSNWRMDVFRRDNFSCRICRDNIGGNLIAHHNKLFSDIFYRNNIKDIKSAYRCDEIWDKDNGITLCIKCHKDEHKIRSLAKKFLRINSVVGLANEYQSY